MGQKVLASLNKILGEERVFDLGLNPHPEDVLARPALVREAETGLRIIVCGGDGTMTWIMASVDMVRERLQLSTMSHKVYVSMMPLGTGNDLARTFGWGGTFRSACMKSSWVEAVRTASPTQLDRWLVSVMPSALQQQQPIMTNIPEVFSVHEYSSAPLTEPRHRIISRGRHHATPFTDTSRMHLEILDAEDARNNSTDSKSSTIYEANFRSAGSKRTTSDASEASSFGDCGSSVVEAHARPSESVLRLGRVWRSYDGTFSNYFSLGVDAAGAFAFHTARRAHPERFTSRLRNQLLYAWLGVKATGGVCCCAPPPPKLVQVASLHCREPPRDGESSRQSSWRQIQLPPACRGLIILNLQSYAGGRDLWGKRSTCRDCCDNSKLATASPAVDDGILEVVTCDSVFDLAATLVSANGLGGRAHRLVRATEIRIKLSTDMYMQIDGEPWLQSPSTVHIKLFGPATVLTKRK